MSEKCKFNKLKASSITTTLNSYFEQRGRTLDRSDIQKMINAVYTDMKKLYYFDDEEFLPAYIRLKVLTYYKARTGVDLSIDANFFVSNIVLEELKEEEVETSSSASNEQLAAQIDDEVNTSDKFLSKNYGLATLVQAEALLSAKTHIFDCCFLDRGFTELSLSAGDLDGNLRKYQLKLFDSIVSYLINVAGVNIDEKDKKLYTELNSTYLYTGAWDRIKVIAKQYLSYDTIGGDSKLNEMRENPKRDKNKARLDAYNAFVFLNNFDNTLKLIFKDSIIISEHGKFTNKLKYNFSEKTSNIINNHRKDENIFLEDEADMITRLLIETTNICDSKGNISKNKYLTFLNFCFINGLTKLWITEKDTIDYKFDDFNKVKDLLPYEQEFIKGKSLSWLLALSRVNYLFVMPIIAKLYLNNKFNNLNIITSLTKDQKESLDTIMYLFYKSENTQSIYSLTDFKALKNIFRNLCQTSDSTFTNILTLNFKDSDGTMYSRLLTDLNEYKAEVDIRLTINSDNASSLQSKNFEESFKLKFGFIREVKRTNDLGVEKTYLLFSIPITNEVSLGIRIDKFDSEPAVVNLFAKDKDGNNIIKSLNEGAFFGQGISQQVHKVIKKLSDDVLSTSFIKNPRIWENFYDRRPNTAYNDITSLIASVLSRMYVTNIDLKNKDLAQRLDFLRQNYNDFDKDIGYNYKNKLINLDPKKGVNNSTLKELARAKTEADGLFTAALVNNSERKAQSLLALSKLVSAYGILLLLQESFDSATEDLDIVKNKTIIKSVSIMNEYFDKDRQFSKKAVAMSVSEIAAMGVITDYLAGLYETDSYKRTKNLMVEFVASVNSDKNTMDKLQVDLKQEMFDGVSYADATYDQVKLSILRNLGSYYSKMMDKVDYDFRRLFEVLPDFLKTIDSGIVLDLGEYYELGFNVINDYSGLKSIITKLNAQVTFLNETLNKNIPLFTERKFIQELTRYYNDNNPNNIILLILNIHVNYNSDGSLKEFSNTIKGQLYRFNYQGVSDYIREYLNDYSITEDGKQKWSNIDLFFDLREREMIGSLVENNTVFNLTNLPVDIREKIEEENPDWVDDSKNLIIARVNGFPISKKFDYIKYFKSGQNIKSGIIEAANVELNPILLKYNALLYLITLQWMFTTVGSFVAHPCKVAKGIEFKNLWEYEMYQESAQYNAQCKRNVSFTALMLLFLLNDIKGINSKYKIAVTDDLTKLIDVLTLKGQEINPLDGATIADPFTVYLENTSLGGNSAGITKKPFIHAKNPQVGNGIIIKTASFGLTNDTMKQSPETALNLFWKMSHHPWKDLQGNPIELNLLQSDITGNGINGVLDSNGVLSTNNLYYSKNGKFYQILNIRYDGNNNYTRLEIEVDITGKRISDPIEEPVLNVNNNFDAWRLFGGLNSMELEDNELVPSEKSIVSVVNCMNEKGFKNPKIGNREIKTLFDFYQPMKLSLINYIVTNGAIKQGLGNVNNADVFDNNTELLIQEIEMIQAGILLDKEHHADFSEVSLPTLIISACAALGYSFNDADNLYNGIARIADIALGEMMKESKTLLDPESKSKFLDLCTYIIIQDLANSNTLNFGTYIAESILKAAKVSKTAFKWGEQLFPISDNTVFNRAVNSLSNYITKNAIKLKNPGSLAIMTPSHKMVLIHGDRKFSDYRDPFKEIRDTLFRHYDNNPIYSREGGNIANVNPDYHYKILRAEPINLWNIEGGVLLKYNNITYNINLKQNRDIPIYNDKVISIFDNKEFAVFDAIRQKTRARRKQIRTESNDEYEIRINLEAFDEYKSLEKYKDINGDYTAQVWHLTVSLGNPTLDDGETPDLRFVNYYDLREQVNSGNIISVIEDITRGRDLGSYNVRFTGSINGSSDVYSIWDLESVQTLHSMKPTDVGYQLAYAKMLRDIKILSKSYINLEDKYKQLAADVAAGKIDGNRLRIESELIFGKELVDSLGDNALKTLYDNEVKIKSKQGVFSVVVDKNSIKHLDYEIIMPLVFRTTFGLKKNTCVGLIVNDTNYFIRQAIDNLESKLKDETLYDIEIKYLNGKHVYIAVDNVNLTGTDFLDITDSVQTLTDDNGNVWRLDKDKKMYQIKPGTRIYANADTELIVISNSSDNTGQSIPRQNIIEYYLKAFNKGSKLRISNNALKLSEQIQTDIYKAIMNSSWNKNFVDEYLDNPQNLSDYIKLYNENIRILTKDDLNQVLYLLRQDRNTLSNEEKKSIDDILKHPDYIAGKSKHNSFIEHLKIIAARIPAQNMQSFMAMKCVGFSNNDRNTAYVSDLLIFLQGSKNYFL